MRFLAWLITTLFIGGATVLIASGIGRRADWDEISKPLLIAGWASMALAIVLAVAMRLVRPGWRADQELRPREHRALWTATIASLAVGIVAGFVVRVF